MLGVLPEISILAGRISTFGRLGLTDAVLLEGRFSGKATDHLIGAGPLQTFSQEEGSSHLFTKVQGATLRRVHGCSIQWATRQIGIPKKTFAASIVSLVVQERQRR